MVSFLPLWWWFVGSADQVEIKFNFAAGPDVVAGFCKARDGDVCAMAAGVDGCIFNRDAVVLVGAKQLRKGFRYREPRRFTPIVRRENQNSRDGGIAVTVGARAAPGLDHARSRCTKERIDKRRRLIRQRRRRLAAESKRQRFGSLWIQRRVAFR